MRKDREQDVRLECQNQIPIKVNGKPLMVGCGKCPVCRLRRSNSWFVRLKEEMRVSDSAIFFTLTYDENEVPRKSVSYYTDRFGNCSLDPRKVERESREKVTREVKTFDKRDVQLFIKRLRKHFPGSRIKYFICSEYGPTTFRPHYHGILYNVPLDTFHWSGQSDFVNEVRLNGLFDRLWKKGYVSVSMLHDKQIKYCSKYCTAQTFLPSLYLFPELRSFLLCSKGLGKSYLDRDELVNYHRTTLDTDVLIDGYSYSMPRYLRDRIFDDEMKEMISERVAFEESCYKMWYLKCYDEYDTTHHKSRCAEVYDKFVNSVSNKIKKSKSGINKI